MPSKPPVHQSLPQKLRRIKERNAKARGERHRGSARQRGYTRQWEKAREAHLAANPLCAYCDLRGKVTPADTVDHLYPHGGDMELFWNTLYWVSCCAMCHNTIKARIERKGKPALDRLAERLGLPVPEGWTKQQPSSGVSAGTAS